MLLLLFLTYLVGCVFPFLSSFLFFPSALLGYSRHVFSPFPELYFFVGRLDRTLYVVWICLLFLFLLHFFLLVWNLQTISIVLTITFSFLSYTFNLTKHKVCPNFNLFLKYKDLRSLYFLKSVLHALVELVFLIHPPPPDFHFVSFLPSYAHRADLY